MKKMFLLCAVMLLAIFSQAQSIKIMNTSCQVVNITIQSDRIPSCGTSSGSFQYSIPIGGTLSLSMYPGGPYPVVNWMNPLPAPNSQFTAVKIYDPGFQWSNGVLRPCLGPISFGPQLGCGAQATSNWTNPALVQVKVF